MKLTQMSLAAAMLAAVTAGATAQVSATTP